MAQVGTAVRAALESMSKTCEKFLHITYMSDNTWGYPIWNAIHALIPPAQLPAQMKREIGDLVLAISVRLDCLPTIINRINDSAGRLYDEVRERDKAADKYAYEPKSGVKYTLLVDINSFLAEVYSGLDLVEKLGKKMLRQVVRKPVQGSLVRVVLEANGKSLDWFDRLENWRHHFTHGGTPWIAVCLDQEPKYDLLIMKSNVHEFTDAETFFRLSELDQVRKGFLGALMLVQQHLVNESTLKRVQPILRQWVADNPHIGELRLFGSYAKGTARSDSDLDIAVRVVRKKAGDTTVWVTACFECPEWEKELTQLLGVQADVEDITAEHVAQYVQEASILVYLDESKALSQVEVKHA